MDPIEQFQENFITASYLVMGELQQNKKDFADWLGIGRVSLYKILERKQSPTVLQAVTLCQKGGFDANWMFLGIGEKKRSASPRKKLQPQ